MSTYSLRHILLQEDATYKDYLLKLKPKRLKSKLLKVGAAGALAKTIHSKLSGNRNLARGIGKTYDPPSRIKSYHAHDDETMEWFRGN